MEAGVLQRVVPDTAGSSLEGSARRIGMMCIAAIRVVTAIVAIVLGAISGPEHTLPAALLAVVALAEVTLTSWWLLRSELPGAPARAVLPFLLDLALLLGGVALTGDAGSSILLLLMVLPSAAGYVLGVPVVLGLGALGLAGLAAIEGPGKPLTTFVVEGAWAIAVGGLVAANRARITRRFARLDAMLGALTASPVDAVRDRVGSELRIAALAPVTSIAIAVEDDPSPDQLQALAGRLQTAILRTRSIVSDLFPFSGASGGLSGGLRRLGERRAAEATVTVDVDPEIDAGAPDDTRDALVIAVVRDALNVAVEGPLRELRLGARPRGADVEVTVEAEPEETRARTDVSSSPRLAAARRALAGRVAAAGGSLDDARPGRVRVRLPPAGVEEPDPIMAHWVPGRAQGTAGLLIGTFRLLIAPVVLAVGLIAGGTETGFVPVAIAWCLAGVVTSAIVTRTDPSAVLTVTIFAFETVVPLVLLGLAGDAQGLLLPLDVALPLAYGLLLRPELVLGAGVAASALVLAVVGATTELVIAMSWGVFVALVLSAGGVFVADGLGLAARRRSKLLARAIAEEDAARRQLAGALHDDALQLMLTVRQDLEEAAEGESEALAHARENIGLVRETLVRAVEELDVGEQAREVSGGLQRSLTSAAKEISRRAAAADSPDVWVEVDPRAAGLADGAALRVARELLTNAMRHSMARNIAVRVHRREDQMLEVVVFDDGVGFDRDRVARAIELGHIGLAAASERLRAGGGSLELSDRDGGGAYIRALVPVDVR